MASGMFLEFEANHHAVVYLLGLGTILVLPLARVPLLRLQKQADITVFPSRACNLGHLGKDLYSKGGCARITILGPLPASRVQNFRMVLNRDCAVQKSEAAKLSVATSFPNAIQFCIVYGKLCFSDC